MFLLLHSVVSRREVLNYYTPLWAWDHSGAIQFKVKGTTESRVGPQESEDSNQVTPRPLPTCELLDPLVLKSLRVRFLEICQQGQLLPSGPVCRFRMMGNLPALLQWSYYRSIVKELAYSDSTICWLFVCQDLVTVYKTSHIHCLTNLNFHLASLCSKLNAQLWETQRWIRHISSPQGLNDLMRRTTYKLHEKLK